MSCVLRRLGFIAKDLIYKFDQQRTYSTRSADTCPFRKESWGWDNTLLLRGFDSLVEHSVWLVFGNTIFTAPVFNCEWLIGHIPYQRVNSYIEPLKEHLEWSILGPHSFVSLPIKQHVAEKNMPTLLYPLHWIAWINKLRNHECIVVIIELFQRPSLRLGLI